MKTLTHEFMATAVLPLTAYETHYTHRTLPNDEEVLQSARIDPITITYYGPNHTGGSQVVLFKDVTGREAWGSVDMYFETAADAQEEIDESWADAKANPAYSVLKAERDAYETLALALFGALVQLDPIGARKFRRG